MTLPPHTTLREGKNAVDSPIIIFSQGSNIDNTNVASNHILHLQKNTLSVPLGRRVNSLLGFFGGNGFVGW